MNSIQFSHYSKRSDGTGLTVGHAVGVMAHVEGAMLSFYAHTLPLQLDRSILRTDSIVTHV